MSDLTDATHVHKVDECRTGDHHPERPGKWRRAALLDAAVALGFVLAIVRRTRLTIRS